ncbi:XapX domain-containing protein [Methylopila henanensis]|uniref:XapX domain-containing protein n=1 Tax=Methylopila henanensis TaxID=873516 RepID=A0ABW4K8A4_9HYPH
MKMYLLSAGAGLLVGVVYSLLHVRSPAPPLVALVGLLGILVGEQIVPVGQKLVAGLSPAVAWAEAKCGAHLFGALPGRHSDASPPPTDGAGS